MLLAAGAVVLLGNLAGYGIRRQRLRKLRKASIHKPVYNIENNVTPAEFGLVVDGAVGYKELVAEIVLLAIRDQVTLTQQPSGTFKVSRNHAAVKQATPIQAAILTALGQQNVGLFTLLPMLKYETERSLVGKGWIVNKQPPLRGLSDVPSEYVRTAVILGLVGLVIAVAVAFIAGASTTDLYVIVAVTLGAEMVIGALVAMVVVFRGELIHNARFVMAATNKYDQQWEEVYGVYEYLRVSGMDIFTPEYETMNFTGLDPLYPYAIAAGLDKKIIKLVV